MFKWLDQSLTAKLITPLVGISLFTILLLYIFFNEMTQRISHDFLEKRAFELAELVILKTESNASNNQLRKVIASVGSYDDVNQIFLINRISSKIIASNENQYTSKHISSVNDAPLTHLIVELKTSKNLTPFFTDEDSLSKHTLIYPFNFISEDRQSIIPLTLVLRVNDNTISKNLNRFLIPTLIIQSMVLLIITGFFYIFAHKLLLNPINQLLWAIDHITDDEEYLVKLPRNKDEIGQLIARYNSMVVQSKEYQQHLITEKEKSEAAAKAKGEFLATMTHELRTPLNGVIGMSNLLKAAQLSDKHSGYLNNINLSGRQLLSVINDILDFSKIESGKLDLNPTNFDLIGAIKNTIDMLMFQAQEKKLTIEFHNKTEQPQLHVHADDTRFNQILINLIGNAIKFTPAGMVTIELTPRPATNPAIFAFELKIIDTGIGISQEKIKFLFEQFSQADASTTRKYGGTGLGLAISKKLCNKMGGHIDVSSIHHLGTTFSITLDFPYAQDSHIEENIDTDIDWQNSRYVTDNIQAKILIADDTPMNLELASAILEDENFATFKVVNGIEALLAVKTQCFDLILMDCLMPEMDGFAASQAIRVWQLNHEQSATPIIALTASALNETKEKCTAAGMNDFMSKPLDSLQLIKTVKHWLMHPVKK